MIFDKFFMGGGWPTWNDIKSGIGDFVSGVGDFIGDTLGISKKETKVEVQPTPVKTVNETYQETEREQRVIDNEASKEEAGSVANNKANLAMKNAKGAANSAGLGKFASAQLMADSAIKAGTEGYDDSIAREKSLAADSRAQANTREATDKNLAMSKYNTDVGATLDEARLKEEKKKNLGQLVLAGVREISDKDEKNIHSFSRLWGVK